MNFRAELQHLTYARGYVVAFGDGSWMYFDNLGLPDGREGHKNLEDRQFYYSAQTLLWKAATRARLELPGPYGTKDSARRRKLCERIASIANEMAGDL